jgi:hypothetical protein
VSECLVDCRFELVVIDGSDPFKDAIATGCIGCLGADIVDGGLFNSSVKHCCPGIIGSWLRYSSAKLSRSAAVIVLSGLFKFILIQTLSEKLTTSIVTLH